MGLTASGQLIDRDPAVFLPCTSGRNCRFVRWISGQNVAKLASPPDQAIEVGQVSLDLRSQAFIHKSKRSYYLRGSGPPWTVRHPAPPCGICRRQIDKSLVAAKIY